MTLLPLPVGLVEAPGRASALAPDGFSQQAALPFRIPSPSPPVRSLRQGTAWPEEDDHESGDNYHYYDEKYMHSDPPSVCVPHRHVEVPE